MDFIDRIKRLQLLHTMIEAERTGTPDNFADRLQVSRSTLYNLIEELEIFGAKICYRRTDETFYFVRPIVFNVHIDIRMMTDEEMKENDGGYATFLSPYKDIVRSASIFANVNSTMCTREIYKNSSNIKLLNYFCKK